MKTIKNRKPFYTHVFVTALLLTLLLSLLTGIVVAPKPARPGKPVETWDLTICIGIEGQDIGLTDPDFLFAEDIPCSGGLWTFPTETKGKSNKGKYVSAQFSLHKSYNETTGEWIGDYCGTYALEHVQGENSDGAPTWLDGFNHNNPDYTIIEVDIGHQVNPLGQDYWWFRLIWIPDPPNPNIWEAYILWAWTDKGEYPEVDPPEGDVLLVQFNGAEAMLYSDWTDEDPQDGLPDNFHWTGSVSFTVEITRELHEA